MKLISLLHDAACIYVRMHTYESVCQYKSFLKAIIAFKHYIVATSSYIGVYIDFTLSGEKWDARVYHVRRGSLFQCILLRVKGCSRRDYHRFSARPAAMLLGGKRVSLGFSFASEESRPCWLPACYAELCKIYAGLWYSIHLDKTSMKIIIIICTKQNSYHPCTRLHAICSMLCWAPSNVWRTIGRSGSFSNSPFKDKMTL